MTDLTYKLNKKTPEFLLFPGPHSNRNNLMHLTSQKLGYRRPSDQWLPRSRLTYREGRDNSLPEHWNYRHRESSQWGMKRKHTPEKAQATA